jgi:hypothetical protein
MAASRCAAAAASTCAHPEIAATTEASSTCLSAATVGKSESNIVSILSRGLNKGAAKKAALWMNF